MFRCVFLLLFFPFVSLASDTTYVMPYLTKDSLENHIEGDVWRFFEGDDPAMAAKDYDDSKWILEASRMYIGGKGVFSNFKGVGWFRLHFAIDTSLVGKPLALKFTQSGASEVYVDGKFVEEFGAVRTKDSTIYYDPQNVPIVIQLSEPGHHVLAVRYANYVSQRNYDRYDKVWAGFRLSVHKANQAIAVEAIRSVSFTFIMVLFFGVFVAISVVHFILYLYNRSSPSNLYFSIFSLCLSGAFIMPFLINTLVTPSYQMNIGLVSPVVIALGCFSLSGFVNEHFSKSRIRFLVITGLSILVAGCRLFSFEVAVISSIVLMTIVALEAAILLIRGIVKRVPGARIIGAGILFFSLFFLTVVVIGLASGGVQINDSTTQGQILELILAIAILSVPISMSAYLAWNFARVNKSLKSQLEQVQVLSEKTIQQEQEKKRMLEGQNEALEQEVAIRTSEIERQHEELKVAKKQSDDLLRNILPEEVAEELKMRGTTDARYFDHVSVLFTDFVNFTHAAEEMTPKELVGELHECFKAFDEIISSYGIEKIKTIGDAYLAVCGLPLTDKDHARKVVSACIEIRDFMEQRKAEKGRRTFDIRVGIHSGPVVAGIVGVKKFAFDIWGDTVNTAARMEQASEAGKINVSQVTYELIKDNFECSYRGEISAKHKGDMKMYFVESSLVVS